MGTIKKITKGMKKRYWLFTILTPITMIGEVFFETVIPYLMALIIDKGIADQNIKYVLTTGAFMIGCSLVSLSCGIGGARFAALASQGFSHNLRSILFNKVQSFSFSNVDKFSTASLVTRLTTDVTNVQNVFQMLIRICFRAPFMLIAGCLMAIKINASLSVVFLISIPVLAFFISFISIKAYPRFSEMLSKYDVMNRIVQENLIAIRVVKAFVRGDYENQKFEQAADDVKKTQVCAERLILWLLPVMQIVIYSTLIAVFWLGGRKVVFGSMLAGELISFLTYVMQILTSLMMIGMIFVSVVLSRASVRRILEVLDEMPDITEKTASCVQTVRDGSIVFNNVNFSYSNNVENCVLNDINLSIKNGQTVGIIGGTGSGKSTLISLVPRLYDCFDGSVKVGGVDVRDYSLKALRDSIAVVLQKNVLFKGTIRDNLLWGNKDASDSEIKAACDASDASSFIESFADGYDTELGQGGVNISGGQKQRLCIARALLKKPKILILDDSTSAVDMSTEARIRTNLKQMFPETTKIIIAQRISSVQDADMIIVMNDGKIDGIGNHAELLKSNEIYQEVYNSQKDYSDADLVETKIGAGE